MSGLLAAAQSAGPGNTVVPPEEIRFAVVLNGGVSLAVWMGGTMLELDRLVKARQGPDQPANPQPADPIYAALLALAGCTARTDVISGTSAGGINGAALALCQVNTGAELGLLRDIWVDQGRIESLLRQPFRGAPTSLLRGDEFFLPQLNNALGLLARPSGWRKPELAPIDLSISTTVLGGNQLVTMDSTGQALPQTLHAGRFHWARLPQTPSANDPFHHDRVERAAHRLALAARCTASFPVAFEPVFVPVNSPQHAEPDQGSKLTQEQLLRPDMAAVVQQWGTPGSTANRSRYAVDGGLLANTPTLAALNAVESMPASGPVRRVMLLVYPHAEPPRPDTAADQAAPPTVLQTVGGLLDALAGQGSRTFVDEIEAHNMFAASRRGTRSEILVTCPTPAGLERLAQELYGHYGRLRQWRAARDLARWATRRSPTDQALTTPPPHGWDYERVRQAADQAQSEWHEEGSPSPYVPANVPSADSPQPSAGWGWGVSTALGIGEAATDVLRRLVWVLPQGPDYDTVREARKAVSAARTRLTAARKLTDDVWQHNPVLASLQPNKGYWQLRLAFYQRLMPGPPEGFDNEALIDALLEEIAKKEAALLQATLPETAGPEAANDRAAEVLDMREVLLAPAPRSAGDIVLAEVLNIVDALSSVRQVLDNYVGPPPPHGSPLPPMELRVLTVWRNVLFPDGDPMSDPELLTRLLQVDIAATTLGDEVTTGATLPVELVQLSAQTKNAFARYSHSGDDKLGGMSVSRFGGFLKRSWRVNDWTWGRIDAASTLCRIVLSPARVRRTAELSGYLEDESNGTPGERAAATVNALITTIFPDGLPPDSRLRTLSKEAVEQLTPVLDPVRSTGELASGLPALADLFAWALHLRIVPAELPVLAGAIRADGVEGANARSRGEVFLTEHQQLLSRLDPATGAPPGEASQQDRCAALAAFDRAGVGREPLTEEGSSDQMLRTATTTAAVSATVVDSEHFGLGAVRPVTRTIRGLMLLPYWTVTGLTSKAGLARGLALLGLAVGAVLLALALFGALPEAISGPATLVGASAVLVALSIGALRSGTMIHGLVLLTPALALLILAVPPSQGSAGEGAIAAALDPRGVATLLLVLALAAGLM
ncbi:MAG: patatin-like protein, partial [Ornithinimicrobium sp.]